jgi:3'(2'), 5'-bisphosphate nucleotidase
MNAYEVTPDLIEAVRRVAREAGAIIMEIYNSEFAVRAKEDRTPVTEADEKSEIHILQALAELTPEIPFIGEENYAAGHRADISGGIFWLVDALDGTKEFVKRLDEFTVNIALVEDGLPIFGVVYAPAKDEMYWGGPPGAFAESKVQLPHAIQARVPAADGMVAVTSRSHRGAEDDFLAAYNVKDRIHSGSSLKFCLIAAGEADIYPRLAGTSEWDTAAAHAVLTAAGGSVKNFDGADLLYGKDDILNPHFIALGCPAD